MANAWERYKASQAYQENEAERRALSLTLAVRHQALQQTGEEVDAQLAPSRRAAASLETVRDVLRHSGR